MIVQLVTTVQGAQIKCPRSVTQDSTRQMLMWDACLARMDAYATISEQEIILPHQTVPKNSSVKSLRQMDLFKKCVAVVKEVMPWLRQILTSALTVLRVTIVPPEMLKNGSVQLAFTVQPNRLCLYLARPANTIPLTESRPLVTAWTAP